MMGKRHRDYNKYAAGGGNLVAPEQKLGRAYGEGYQAQVKGLADTANPHMVAEATDPNSDWTAWEQGWKDANAAKPPTFVGGPTGVAPTPPPGLRRASK